MEKGSRKSDKQRRNGTGIIADWKESMLNETKADSVQRRVKRSAAG